jgi:hypothetical protein
MNGGHYHHPDIPMTYLREMKSIRHRLIPSWLFFHQKNKTIALEMQITSLPFTCPLLRCNRVFHIFSCRLTQNSKTVSRASSASGFVVTLDKANGLTRGYLLILAQYDYQESPTSTSLTPLAKG